MALISFKSFIKNKKKAQGPYIHFKDVGHPESSILETYILEDFNWLLPKVKDKKWGHNDNAHIGSWAGNVNKRLADSAPKFKGKDKTAIQEYTHKNGGSGKLNLPLINPSQKVSQEHHNIMTRLHRVVSNPIGHNVSLYSGVGSDPRNWDKEKDGSTRLRAFTSMTPSKNTARLFGHQHAMKNDDPDKGKLEDVHMIHLHMKPTDKGLPVSDYSKFSNELETVLPPDTHIIPHPDHPKPDVHKDAEGRNIYVHHYVVHSQHAGDGSWKPANPVG
jgi:hypothetical protein